jgi:D-alanyl-D-alanine carboxypeptidase
VAAASMLAVVLLAAGCSDDGGSGGGAAATTTTAAAPLDAALTDEITDTVEATMEELAIPGAVVLIRNADGQYLQAFGTRTVGEDDPVTVEDHFRIGSNTKTMTGTVLLQLVDEGEVSLDDPVSKYRPEVPNGDNITIAQLLDMRSGLASYTLTREFNQVLDDEPDKVWDPEELALMGEELPVDFAPGQGWAYSNTNTVLAGLVVEEVTGKDLRDVMAERIFEPLGMDDTQLPATDDDSIPEPHPHGYLWGTNVSTMDDPELPEPEQSQAFAGTIEPSDVTNMNPSWGWAAGAGISTATDLAHYVEVLVNGGLLSDELQDERLDSLVATSPSNPPTSPRYGLALATLGPLVGHDGSLPGFQSVMGHDPETGTTMIVFTNLQASPDGQQTANVIAQRLIPVVWTR